MTLSITARVKARLLERRPWSWKFSQSTASQTDLSPFDHRGDDGSSRSSLRPITHSAAQGSDSDRQCSSSSNVLVMETEDANARTETSNSNGKGHEAVVVVGEGSSSGEKDEDGSEEEDAGHGEGDQAGDGAGSGRAPPALHSKPQKQRVRQEHEQHLPTGNNQAPALAPPPVLAEGAPQPTIEEGAPKLLQPPEPAASTPLPSIRRQSLVSPGQSHIIRSLLHGPLTNDTDVTNDDLDLVMVTTRKIWVKRPHASATLVTISDDDLVDNVRDFILSKYANSLGRSFDPPDLTLRIVPRDPSKKERLLGPEEPIARVVEGYYPGGQTIDEALVIDIPRRTPKPSPRPTALHVTHDGPPSEAGEGYFPPINNTPRQTMTLAAPPNSVGHGGTSSPNLAAAAAISSTPGPAVATADPGHGMQHYILRPSHSRAHSASSDHKPPPTGPPVTSSPGTHNIQQEHASTPPARVSSPRPSVVRPKKPKKPDYSGQQGTQGILSGGVPPISVLIVEDNPINLKLLEAFVKRLKVRWQTAMNGRDAVKMWRNGGFHLVLMDIQLPGMNGLDATREIRRLERLNSIGVFSSSPDSLPQSDDGSTDPGQDPAELEDQDRLENISLFKSPVIIVALTASSLQSDRHEALAAGCNDFLTKPVNFVWLERKVMEWGCMQALIDFDGWRKWKDISQQQEQAEAANKAAASTKLKSKKKDKSLALAADV
ncbi:osomolarity two-component system, response regulator SSK1 [Geosmithia morbida]|uniref:Osomolarity two-component system, response regulator SSK1 n=1 Tax=Geosmithia morbida TaxID=1094350 RepID=A0A9P5D2W9_9HYPO|nr:osomolarity two-component system, response regulator SSK1 [Geosmithia morbida]KAF4119914.1 osomolarity two-component system, response regulator SSK1 [Geosmithia morbida]